MFHGKTRYFYGQIIAILTWPEGKPPFSYGFPMVFPWFSHGFPIKTSIFPWFSTRFARFELPDTAMAMTRSRSSLACCRSSARSAPRYSTKPPAKMPVKVPA